MLQKFALALSLLLLVGLSIAQAETSAKEVKVSIPNMVCMSCEMRVEQAVFQVTGVSRIEFDSEGNIATIAFDPGQTSLEAILAACEEAGYPATVVDSTEV